MHNAEKRSIKWKKLEISARDIAKCNVIIIEKTPKFKFYGMGWSLLLFICFEIKTFI